MAEFSLEALGTSFLGLDRTAQNQQQLDLEQQKLELNKQILAQSAASKSSSNTTIIVLCLIGFVVVGVTAYFLFFRK